MERSFPVTIEASWEETHPYRAEAYDECAAALEQAINKPPSELWAKRSGSGHDM